MLRGLNPWWHWLLERENPRTLQVCTWTTSRGPFLHLDHSRIAAKRCHYNTGDYMTLAELGMAFWHDLAVPVIAGILASMIVNWLNKRK